MGFPGIRRGRLQPGLFCFKSKRELLDLALWDADTTWQKGCAQIRGLYVFNFELEEENYGESWVSDNEVWSPDVQSLAARDGRLFREEHFGSLGE